MNRKIPKRDGRPGLAPSRLRPRVFCLLLPACWLLPSAARADVGCGESGLVTIDNDRCAESGVFVIDNSNCAESGVFAVDNRYAPADFDHDGDVDSDDLAVFQACVSGPGIAYSGDCAKADFDHDGDVDQTDYGIFLKCMSGAGVPADPNCAVETPLLQHQPPPPIPGDQSSG